MSVVYLVTIQLEDEGHIFSLLARVDLEHLPVAAQHQRHLLNHQKWVQVQVMEHPLVRFLAK